MSQNTEIPVEALVAELQSQIAQLSLDLALTRAQLKGLVQSQQEVPTQEESPDEVPHG